ncbi:hypothetical protein [Zooshikella ganghwensis]|uniref:hypothetical protein n=1 Tax=Zooshikella ganghwensis TaxID=202772 RepID=UPI003B8A7B46
MYIGGSYLLAVFAFYLLTFIYACIRGGEESNSQNTPKMNKQIKVKSKKHRKGSRKSSYQYSTDYTDYSSSSGSDTCSSSSSDSSGSCD